MILSNNKLTKNKIMKLVYSPAPFLGETPVEAYGHTELNPKPPKLVLSFGPIQTPKGQIIRNITRGKDDKTVYVFGLRYHVPVLEPTCYKDNIYYTTAGGSTLCDEKVSIEAPSKK